MEQDRARRAVRIGDIAMSDRDKDELLRLRAENEKLQAQVEGLKECVGFAVAQIIFPTMSNDHLLVVGKSMMKRLDVDKLIASWRENTKPKSISEIAKMKSFLGVENDI